MVSDTCYKVGGTQRCVNTDPGFHCLPCPKRYKGTQPFGMGVEAAKKNKQVSRQRRQLSQNVTLRSQRIFKSRRVDFCLADLNL